MELIQLITSLFENFFCSIIKTKLRTVSLTFLNEIMAPKTSGWIDPNLEDEVE